MATGLKVPISVNANGGIALISGDENDAKIIALALGDGDNENAFMQDITMGNDMIFDINDPSIRANITMTLVRIFEEFEKQNRFKLLYDTIEWTETENVNEEGEIRLKFRYLNIESDKIYEFDKKYGGQ